MLLKAIKIRIYPTKEQEVALAKSFGCTRWLWNRFLAQNNEVYKETGKGLSRLDYQNQLPQLKKELDWLKETYSQCLQIVCLNLSRAFINFFEGRARYPRFKSKHGRQSIIYPQHIKIEGDYLKVPKIGHIFSKIHREVTGNLKTVTVSKNADGKYYASLLFEVAASSEDASDEHRRNFEDEKKAATPLSEGKAIGLDLSLTDFVVTSDNSKIKQPKWMKKRALNLKRKQQKLARKVIGSKSRDKARLLVAKTHSKVTRCREDFLHKLSRKIVNENQVIVVEDLHVKGMVHNPNLSKAISQVGWGMFCTMLKYKAEQEGKIYLEVNRFFPSSKTCHVCLNVVESLPLDIRSWTCNSCKTTHDRDCNAAINIRNEGLRILASGTGATAEGGYVSPKRGRKKSTVGQQPVNSEAHAVPLAVNFG